MAFWFPSFSVGDAHASDACLSALAQQEAMSALRAQLPEITGMRRNPPKLRVRMGIATGEAIVGTIGSSAARSYTVIGDTVNLAARLEDINKVYGSSIICPLLKNGSVCLQALISPFGGGCQDGG